MCLLPTYKCSLHPSSRKILFVTETHKQSKLSVIEPSANAFIHKIFLYLRLQENCERSGIKIVRAENQ